MADEIGKVASATEADQVAAITHDLNQLMLKDE